MNSEELERRVLHEKEGLLVIDKPHDLPTSGRSLEDTDCLQYPLMERQGAMVWAVHQLDADTSGANLFTTRRSMVEPLKRALAGGEKRYLAVVHGVPDRDCITCEAPLGEIAPGSLGVHPGGRTARSTMNVLERSEDHALLEVSIETGRTHQIRIHLAHLGHPLVGEEWYRDPPCTLHPRQALHAWHLCLAPPFELQVEAPVPPDLVQLLARLGMRP